MAINNTQKNIIAKKQELCSKIVMALRASKDFADVDYFEVVGDCNIAFYVIDGNGKRQVFELAGSFKKASNKASGSREPEDIMCDLLDAYEAKQEGRRCREALAVSKPKKTTKKKSEDEE